MIHSLKTFGNGRIEYVDATMGVKCSADLSLYLIRQAWERGMYLEDLADGFGRGMGTQGGDWSGVRDSSEKAIARMLERALNHAAAHWGRCPTDNTHCYVDHGGDPFGIPARNR